MQVREFNATIMQVPDDNTAGTQALGQAMVYLARSAAHDPVFVNWAQACCRDIPSKAHRSIARRLLDWVRSVVRYRYDALGQETIQDPRHTLLVSGCGDCDCMVALICALALALGYRSCVRFVKSDESRPDEFSHVYALVAVPNGQGDEDWTALDATQASAEPGWEPPYWAKMDMVVA